NRDVLLYKDGGRPGEFEPHVAMFGDGFPFASFAINEHVYRLRAIDEVGQNYLYFFLTSTSATDEMRVRGTGVAIPGLNSTQLKEMSFLRPPTELMKRFNEAVEPMVSRVLLNSRESQTLAALRDTLLPKLIS